LSEAREKVVADREAVGKRVSWTFRWLWMLNFHGTCQRGEASAAAHCPTKRKHQVGNDVVLMTRRCHTTTFSSGPALKHHESRRRRGVLSEAVALGLLYLSTEQPLEHFTHKVLGGSLEILAFQRVRHFTD
jgi:hypothetical protein